MPPGGPASDSPSSSQANRWMNSGRQPTWSRGRRGLLGAPCRERRTNQSFCATYPSRRDDFCPVCSSIATYEGPRSIGATPGLRRPTGSRLPATHHPAPELGGAGPTALERQLGPTHRIRRQAVGDGLSAGDRARRIPSVARHSRRARARASQSSGGPPRPNAGHASQLRSARSHQLPSIGRRLMLDSALGRVPRSRLATADGAWRGSAR